MSQPTPSRPALLSFPESVVRSRRPSSTLPPPSGSPVVVLDAGSYSLRAGFSLEHSPRLEFQPLTARPKSKTRGEYVLVGDQLSLADRLSSALHTRTPFASGVVLNFDVFEDLLDYTLAGLGLNSISSPSRLPHPVLLTEAFLNPSVCRQRTFELLFECYRAPSACLGNSDLFALSHNYLSSSPTTAIPSPSPSSFLPETALLISSSYEATHLIPVLEGKTRTGQARRIDIGGSHIAQYVQDRLLLSHPTLRSHITPARSTYLMETFGDVRPEGLPEFLSHVEIGKEGGSSVSPEPVIFQLPFVEDVVSVESEEVKQAKLKRKQELAERLRKAQQEKRWPQSTSLAVPF